MPMTPCEQCHSEGVVRLVMEVGDVGAFLDAMPCPLCRGEGCHEITGVWCWFCGNDGGSDLLVRLDDGQVMHWYHRVARDKLVIKLGVA